MLAGRQVLLADLIGAVADLTALRCRSRSVLVVGTVAGSRRPSVFCLAARVEELVVGYPLDCPYSLFIGLTLRAVCRY
ncbi:MAG: hypothetical protein U5P10_08470 [Spirochaetia bacterium]|nr:hypothetical protein [Spirochaetia bacterium]